MAIVKKDTQDSEASKPKRNIHRSPNYPAFSLEDAIAKARVLWEKDHKAGSPPDVTLRHLGFEPKHGQSFSGPAARTLATLKTFGLTEERDGRIYLSQIGLDIVIYSQTDERCMRAIADAALKPNVYSRIYDRYKAGLPSDDTVKAELVRVDGFNPKQVDGFLDDFKRTLEFAGLHFDWEELEEGEMLEQSRVDQGAKSVVSKSAAPSSPSSQIKVAVLANSFPILLKKQNQAMIGFARLPLDKADLQLLKQWIDLMAENLTEESSEEAP
ncbi:hypothetical protein [Candidatus Methylomirabilis sp.]|uniref:hypothetical protein n=1 Tax=Candidatus Methylomirabilis sp. TaxID=2032687 RepID=UPI002A6638F8|nr:hypothetical protein [Candidatus Methylomirabilis sp.]